MRDRAVREPLKGSRKIRAVGAKRAKSGAQTLSREASVAHGSIAANASAWHERASAGDDRYRARPRVRDRARVGSERQRRRRRRRRSGRATVSAHNETCRNGRQRGAINAQSPLPPRRQFASSARPTWQYRAQSPARAPPRRLHARRDFRRGDCKIALGDCASGQATRERAHAGGRQCGISRGSALASPARGSP
jgi:hypothetical protein